MPYLLAMGILAGLLAALAAALMAARRLLVPLRCCAIDVNDRWRVLRADSDQTLLEALYNHELFIPSACGGRGTCGACKLTVLAGGGPVLPTETPHLSEAEIRSGVRLACRAPLRGDVRIRVPPHLLEARRFLGELAEATMPAADTRLLRLRLREPPRIQFVPGQYVQVEVPADEGLALRAYSICSTPSADDAIDLLVRLVPGGLGSTYLHRLAVGQRVWFTGPYGEFRLIDDPAMEVVCVAGGCGVAPMRAIVGDLVRRWPGRRCWLYLGFRREDQVVWLEEFQSLAQAHEGLSVVCAVEAPRRRGPRGGGPPPGTPRHGPPWDGEVGLIHDVLDRHLPPGANRQAFLCGPEEMVRSATDVLIRKGLPPERVYSDVL